MQFSLRNKFNNLLANCERKRKVFKVILAYYLIMDKKVMIGVGVIIVVLVIGGFFALSKKDSSYQNPSSLDELKQAKSEGKSEYDKCLKEIEAVEQARKDCIKTKLEEKGYTDGIDCIMEFDNPICDDISRYNAEVDASNECMDEHPSELTIIDCSKLIGK